MPKYSRLRPYEKDKKIFEMYAEDHNLTYVNAFTLLLKTSEKVNYKEYRDKLEKKGKI